MTRALLKPVWFVLAVLFLVEAWLWDHLGPIVRRMVDLLPWREVKARLAAGVERLPPLATLALFVVPAAAILPFKIVGLALVAGGHVVLGALTFAAAKVVGFGLTAFLFDLCRPKLMTMPLFVRVYDWCIRAKAWAHDRVAPISAAMRAFVRRHRPEGRFAALILRFRDRVRRRRAAPSS